MCSTQVHTAPRPLRGVQSLGQGGATASATIALEADTARHSPRLPKRPNGLQAKRSKNSGDFFGALRVRGGDKPLFAKKQSNTQNLENIRENTILKS